MHRWPVMSLTAAVVTLASLVPNPAAASTITVLGTSTPLESTWATDDNAQLELGLRLTTSQDGYVRAVRFYKNPLDTGSHSAHVWAADGTLLASTDFTGESPSGWQVQALATPVHVAAGSTFTVSVFYPNGAWYPRETFASPSVSPFSALQGTYAYSSTSAFPGGVVGGRNYFIDLEYGSATSYTASGYLAPVKTDSVTIVKGGSTVPLKFQVMESGTEITTTDLLGFSVSLVSCEGAPPADPVEIADGSVASLRYDVTANQFIQNWRVPRTRGSCYVVRHDIGGETLLSATFRTA